MGPMEFVYKIGGSKNGGLAVDVLCQISRLKTLETYFWCARGVPNVNRKSCQTFSKPMPNVNRLTRDV